MRDTNLNESEPLDTEYIPMEFKRITEEEFEMWDQEPCIASAD
jgi:hypothetical protein